ncbi:MAG: Uma2 family endonuclease [Gemmatimonadota bacterium]
MKKLRANTDDRVVTLEEYERLPEEPGYIVEVSKGRLVREPQPGARHGRVSMKIAQALLEFVRAHELGSVEMQAGFVIGRDPLVVRGPDVAFIARSRLPETVPVSFWPFAPDLAIEVLSPSNTASQIETKVLEYLDGGSRMVWVIDPETRTARIYAGNEARIVRENDNLDGSAVIPGFRLPLSSVLI